MKVNKNIDKVPVKQKAKQHEPIIKIISISLPFLFIVLLEFGLRTFNYGYNSSLFVKDKLLPDYYSMNHDVAGLFFNDPVKLSIFDEPFRKTKPVDTYRIFVLGESTGLGYPYSVNGSFHRMLLYRLNRAFPNKKIEILNLSITGINSYTLRSFTNQIVMMNPDAIMIYAGHNEYYGALGVASNQRLGLNRNIINASIYLKRFRVVQLAFNITRKVKTVVFPKIKHQNMGMMQEMADKQQVVFGSKTFKLGLKQFEMNMDEMLKIYNTYNIPVYLSNIVSNEKGLKPFISKLNVSTDTAKFMVEYKAGLDAFNKKDFNTSFVKLLAVNKIDSTYAMNNFLLGEMYYEKGDFADAHRYYSNAKEMDALRFRAPDAINTIIDSFCHKYSNIHFVDSKKKFIANSDHGILDNKLFVEHLHPTLLGYFLISDAFYDVLLNTKIFGNCEKIIPSDSIRKELPLTAVDSLTGRNNTLLLRSQWPFYEHSTVGTSNTIPYVKQLFELKLSWVEMMFRLSNYYLGKGNTYEALRVLKGICLQFPYNWTVSSKAGDLCIKLKNYSEALFYLKNAFEYNKDVNFAKKIALVLIKLDRLDESKQYLTYINKSGLTDQISAGLLETINKILQLKPEVIANPTNIKKLNLLTGYYIQIGNFSIARIYLNKSLVINVKDVESVRLLGLLNKLEKSETTSDIAKE